MDWMINSLILLLKDDFADSIYAVCRVFGITLRKTKWNDMKCGYKQCNNRRIDVDMIYIGIIYFLVSILL